jgi:hypothetical protein
MRILWVGKEPSSGKSGDEIFDRQTIAACRSLGHAIDMFHPSRVSLLAEICNLISGLPHYRTRFASSRNISAILETAKSYDAVICSWEPFDVLIPSLSIPTIMILHNVTSRALPALFPNNLLATFAGSRAAAWERRWYQIKRFSTIAVLSKRDFRYLEGYEGRPNLLLLTPGMPPSIELNAEARLIREIVVAGTFEWVPKHRDILRFSREYAPVRWRVPVRAAGLPPEAARLLQPLPIPSPEDCSEGLRFGLITDRFEAGHKLKTMAHIAANQIVLTFADVSFDFTDVPDYDFFIRKIDSIADIVSHMDVVAALPAADLRQRFVSFQQSCARRFTWSAVGAALLKAAGDIDTDKRERAGNTAVGSV